MARKKKAPPSRLKRLLNRIQGLIMASLLAVILGTGIIASVLYLDAKKEVESRLAQDMWVLPGRVYSAPLTLWPGLALEMEDLATDLRAAGYVQVREITGPGEFQVAGEAVHVWTTAAEGPGWRIEEEEILITLEDGKVKSTSPTNPATLAPVLLAKVRGPQNEDRIPRELEDFPPALRQAVLAMEDARFFDHPGISVIGILRALYVNIFTDRPLQGGSTLTQQLAKNLFLGSERTLSRKTRELFLTIALERSLEKDAILTLYLNQIYWGQVGGVAICGAEEAARTYFGKPVERLSLEESATLGGIISAPNTYSPTRHPERAQQRRDLALERMQSLDWISEAEAEAASRRKIEVLPALANRRAPYAVDAAMESLGEELGTGTAATGGLEIYTRFHPVLQRIAERSIEDSVQELEGTSAAGAQMALAAVRVSDGSVVALVGGRSYAETQFNRALHAQRQVGSTAKSLTLLAAFDADPALAPSSLIEDDQISRSVDGVEWSPENYDGEYEGEIPIRDAIARSRNIPAVLLAERVGLHALDTWLAKVGLSSARPLPSIALGAFEASPLDLAQAYTVFPGQGEVASPQLLQAVIDADATPLWTATPQTSRVASARAAALATSVLESVVRDGTASSASDQLQGPVAGKTGTTDETRDAWFAGFTPELAVVVWVGHDQGEPLGMSGARAALPAWTRFVADSGTVRGAFPMPEDLVQQEICFGDWTGGECDECGLELFTRGQAPQKGCEEPSLFGSIWERIGGTESTLVIRDGQGPMRSADVATAPATAQPETPRRRLFWRRRKGVN